MRKHELNKSILSGDLMPGSIKVSNKRKLIK